MSELDRNHLAWRMRRLAHHESPYDGHPTAANQAKIARMTQHFAALGLTVIFTRDQGMHSSGWWKNPDFERCYHLSLSFWEPRSGLARIPRPFDAREAERWARALYRDDLGLTWWEGPWSPEGKARDVHHVRLFCDPGWQPIRPRGEVYSRAHIPSDWRSWSEVQAERALTGAVLSVPVIGEPDV